MEVVSTLHVSAAERFGFWRELNAQLWAPYEMRGEPRLTRDFEAQVGISDFGPVQVTLMTTMPHTIHRTPRAIRQGDPEMFKVGCVVHGGALLTQDKRSVLVGPGDLTLYDTSRSYSADIRPDLPTSRTLLLRFPRSLLPLPPKEVRELSAGRIPGSHGVGALSSQFLLQLARHLAELSPADGARLATLTLDVLTTALADALDAQRVVPEHTRRRALMAQVHAFIRDHLGDAGLTPDAIAAAHFISPRYLHKLFQQEGRTVAGRIRELRLERCRRDLADPRLAGRPINAIAARWGFSSSAHFSQAFRAEYGVPPREFRQRSAAAARAD